MKEIMKITLKYIPDIIFHYILSLPHTMLLFYLYSYHNPE